MNVPLYQIVTLEYEVARIRLEIPPVVGELLILRQIDGSTEIITPGDYTVTQLVRYYCGGLYESAVRKVIVKLARSHAEVYDFKNADRARLGMLNWERGISVHTPLRPSS